MEEACRQLACWEHRGIRLRLAVNLSAQQLRELRALGVGLALDDFGTGHSSLAYLRQLPVARIKVDHAFMRRVPEDASDATLVRAIVGLAHTMGLQVVVEGVEQPSQLDWLRELDCTYYQGWLFARASPPQAIEAL